MNRRENKDERRLLELLDVVGQKSDVSQRHLARHLGVALGLANSYLRRCVRKGWIKISTAPANRYLYYLTPKGFSEKSRLTAKYLSTSFEFYREAGRSCARALDECRARGWQRVLLCGDSDLAEIAVLRAWEQEIQVVGVFDPGAVRQQLLGRKVWRTLKAVDAFDGCVLTDLRSPQERYQELVADLGTSRILVPDILRL
ncbi:MAG: winged helix-turn-helix transcriptional regulator [Sulfurifustaceae bacterium]